MPRIPLMVLLRARVVLCALVLAGLGTDALARDHGRGRRAAPAQAPRQAVDVGPQAAASAARAATGGRVLSVREGRRDGRPTYRVKLLLDGGRVRTLNVDRASGRLLR